MSNRLRHLATFIAAGALLASTSLAQAAPAWPANPGKLTLHTPAGKGSAPAATGVSGYAVVRAVDGTAQFESNVTGVEHLNTGFFAVEFNSDVSRCAYSATLGDPVAHTGSPPAFGFISVVNAYRVFAAKNAVLVLVADPSGTAADLNFHLTVTC